MMYQNGYEEEIARRSFEDHGRHPLKPIGDVLLAAGLLAFGIFFWIYVAVPTWRFGREIVEITETNRRGAEALAPLVGKCFDNGVGKVGIAISVVDSGHVKVAFATGFSQSYPVVALRPAACPSN